MESLTDTTLRQAIIELYYWQEQPTADNFSALLYNLLKKAAAENLYNLQEAFPAYEEAIRLWNEAGDNGNDLFRNWEIGRFKTK